MGVLRMTESGAEGLPLIEDEELSNLSDTDAETLEADAEDGAPKKKGLPEIPIAEVAVIASEEDLKRVLQSHREWMAGVLDPKVEVAAGRANLSGQDLRGYDLRDVNLSAANLSGANLQGVDLQSANLSAANLTGAMLACANLAGAKLRGARIDGADLRGADLTGANLGGLDLSRAILKSPDAPKTDVTAEVAPDPIVTEGEVPHVDL
jgi:uncharacterized protein YjbI with pentapeptide repeats